ncbi:hypothetical protein [Acrocarpospora catenulata]|uniref:hypothetical protein n=1 Tax=Acrocarpospora catenulata TaxID=2836182 RepID=UPI001BDAC7FA|nr:hypothetical protein [Acrocarpospora catenulata]
MSKSLRSAQIIDTPGPCMNSDAPPPRRFDQEFVEEYQRRHGAKTPQGRSLTYDNAVDEEFAPRRAWLDEQLGRLPAKQADRLARNVWLDEHYWPVHFEMATGAALRRAGLQLVYDRSWDGQTPDWTVLTDDGKPVCLVEVHTASPPRETYGNMRAWHQLTQQIKKIPVGVVLMLEPTGQPIPAPTAKTAKKAASEVHQALSSPGCPSRIPTSTGHTFLVQASRYGYPLPSPFGLFACFEPPSSIAGQVSAEQIIGPIRTKINKYRQLVNSHDLPLVVAVGAHPFTGLGLEELDDLLHGQSVITFQFKAGDTHIGRVNSPSPKWDMPPELAGLLWVENAFPFAVTSRPNAAAERPMPAALTDLSDHV